MKQTGTIKWYDFEKGIGFASTNINGKDEDVLIHFSELKNALLELYEGDFIEFDLEYVRNKPKATNIRLLLK